MRLDVIEKAYQIILSELGEDITREGLVGTPARIARFWKEFIDYDPGNLAVTFESVQIDQMIVVSGVRVWSMCEHHLLPFWCDIAIAYLATQRVLGLSKLARIAHKHAHKLQLQERLVQQIADDISQMADTENVAVLGTGQHLCMVMRGIKTPGLMHTSVMRGVFRESSDARAEFLDIIKLKTS